MGKILKKMKNENKILTNQELKEIKNQIYFIQEEFKALDAMYKDKSYDSYYFEKSKNLGNKLEKHKRRLRQGLKINKKLEKRTSKC